MKAAGAGVTKLREKAERFADFWDRFFAFELEESAFTREYRGTRYWAYIRFFVAHELTLREGLMHQRVFESTPQRRRRSPTSPIRRVVSEAAGLSREAARRRRTAGLDQYDLLLVGTDQIRRMDGKSVDYQLSPFVRRVPTEFSTLLVSHGFLDPASYACDVMSVRAQHLWAKARSLVLRLSSSEQAELDDLADGLRRRFGFAPDLTPVFREIFLPQHLSIASWSALIDQRGVKAVGFINNLRKGALVEAARRAECASFEIQHGSTGPFALAHSHPPALDRGEVPTIPDFIFTFGSYWESKFVVSARTVPVGCPYFEDQADRTSATEDRRHERDLLVISTRDQRVAAFAVRLAALLPDHRVFFKLRPVEYPHWRNLYGDTLASAPNLTVIDSDDVHLYSYLRRCAYVMAAHSTAIYEGLALGARPIVLDGNESEDLLDLVDAGHAAVAGSPEEASEIVVGGVDLVPVVTDEIFATDSRSLIASALEPLLADERGSLS